MADVFDKGTRSYIMSRIKGKDTKPEIVLRKALFASGLRGYRIHRKDLPGRPDIAYIGRRIAIFVHGCFWHRCPHCQLVLPKTNTAFWQSKFEANQARDKKKAQQLEQMGWKVLIVWECQIDRDITGCVSSIRKIHDDKDQGD